MSPTQTKLLTAIVTALVLGVNIYFKKDLNVEAVVGQIVGLVTLAGAAFAQGAVTVPRKEDLTPKQAEKLAENPPVK